MLPTDVLTLSTNTASQLAKMTKTANKNLLLKKMVTHLACKCHISIRNILFYPSCWRGSRFTSNKMMTRQL
uniref:Uncharacterized protein n=1 Tax=Gossypium raimondii TaxID=29730 RepID=A0A0D2QS51_GOSRA|nr:hypothetical protein B456_007G133900 [Gossypium raimondii]